MPAVERTIDINARPSHVWKWFESGSSLSSWFKRELTIDLRVGGAYELAPDESGITISGRVLEIIPEGRLVLSWFEEDQGWKHPARLVFELTPIATGTRVTLIHDGFAGIGTESWERTTTAYGRGADRHNTLGNLAELIEAAA